MQTITEEESENNSASQENILANSIRNARSILQKKQLSSSMSSSFGNGANSVLRESKRKQSSSSAAQAIKVLHDRISKLEAFNSQLTVQINQLKKDIYLKNQQISTCKCELENEQMVISALKEKINQNKKVNDEKDERITGLQKEVNNLIRINANLESASIKQDNQFEKVRKHKEKYEDEIREFNKRLDTYQKLIARHIHEVEQEKQKNADLQNKLKALNTHEKSRQTITFPAIIDSPQLSSQLQQQYTLSSNRKSNTRNRSATYTYNPTFNNLEPIEQQRSNSKDKKFTKSKKQQLPSKAQQISELKYKNKNLSQMLKQSTKRYEQQLQHKKMLEQQLHSLSQITSSIIDEVNLLPNNLTHKFKLWIVKYRKISTSIVANGCQHQRITKSVKRRQYSNSRSRESNKSKSRKPLKMEDLNISEEYSCQSRSHTKSHKKSSYHVSSNSGKKVNKTHLSIRQYDNKAIKMNCKKIHEIQAKLLQHQKDQSAVNPLKKQLERLYQQNQALQNRNLR